MKHNHLRITSLLLSLILLLSVSLVACKSKDDTPNYVQRDQSGDGESQNENEDLTNSSDQNVKYEITLAEITDFNKIRYSVTNLKDELKTDCITVENGDKALTVLNITADGEDLTSGTIELSDSIDLTKECRVTLMDYGSVTAIPTDVFDTEDFVESYVYTDDDLGSSLCDGTAVFKVWTPLASSVTLNLFANDTDAAYLSLPMTKGELGVWSCTLDCSRGIYYTYSITTPYGTSEAVDPYAKAVSQSGKRGIVTDSSLINPDGNADGFTTGIKSYSEAIVWEVNVGEFSNMMSSSSYKGKYLAFTESGLKNESGERIGVDYLVNLGITHVNPVSVYGKTDNKGYYAPSPDYATSAESAVTEYKKMVNALHLRGIGVIMEIDLEPIFEEDSSLNKIVPYYFAYPYARGERDMIGNFIVSCAKYWIETYDLDGISFKNMGLATLDTIEKTEAAIHGIDPEAIIYGDGENPFPDSIGSSMADHESIGSITATNDAIGGVAVLNNVMCNGICGGASSDTKGYVNGGGDNADFGPILFGIRGGAGTGSDWSVDNAMVVNRAIPYGNLTLFDKLNFSGSSDTSSAAVGMNRLTATLLSVSKGITLISGGEEMLRTRQNGEIGIDWSKLVSGSDEYNTTLYYRDMIALRKDYGIFTSSDSSASAILLSNGIAAVMVDCGNGNKALIVTNPTDEDTIYTLGGIWYAVTDGERVIKSNLPSDVKVSVPAYSAIVFFSENALNGASV